MLLHRFRWVYCQLDVLRQCFPSSVRGVLAGLPESLDETYERILQQIPNSNRAHTHRLLQCLVVAARPLKVEELAEVLAIDFSATGMTPTLDENLRWEDKERAVLSACSSLVTIVQDWSGRLVQFSHFSVKEFLTSDRLAVSSVDTLRRHHIRLEPAHVMMAQVCLGVLLQVESDMDVQTIRSYPLSDYAGRHFGSHVESENVISSISDGMDSLLDRDKPYFYTWVWLQTGYWDSERWDSSRMDKLGSTVGSPTPDVKPNQLPRLPPLYYVAALGHLGLARHLILKCPQDLGFRDDKGCTPLHIAVLAGNEGVSQLLIEHSVDLDIRDINDRTLLHMTAYMGLAKATQILLERGEGLKARLNSRDKSNRTPLHFASQRGHYGIAGLFLKLGAEVDAQDNDSMTPLFLSSQDFWGNYSPFTKTAKLLLEHGASVHMRNKKGQMPLHGASYHGHSDTVALLLKIGAGVDAQDNDSMTPLLWASQQLWGNDSGTAQHLLEHGASVHVRNKNGLMPLHLASQYGLPVVVETLLKFGADVEARDNSNMTPLHFAVSSVFRNELEPQIVAFDIDGTLKPPILSPKVIKIIKLLLGHGANPQMQNDKGETPFHLALARGEQEIIDVLSDYVQNAPGDVACITASVPYETMYESTEGSSP